jgi:hypothetical protein
MVKIIISVYTKSSTVLLVLLISELAAFKTEIWRDFVEEGGEIPDLLLDFI